VIASRNLWPYHDTNLAKSINKSNRTNTCLCSEPKKCTTAFRYSEHFHATATAMLVGRIGFSASAAAKHKSAAAVKPATLFRKYFPKKRLHVMHRARFSATTTIARYMKKTLLCTQIFQKPTVARALLLRKPNGLCLGCLLVLRHSLPAKSRSLVARGCFFFVNPAR